MAELDERIITVEAAITCCTPFGMEPLPTWFVDTVREMMARDAERGVQISKLEAENAELREQLKAVALKACTQRHRAEHCPLLGRVDELRAENAELREQLEGLKRRNRADGALIDSLRGDIQRLWHEHKSVVAYRGCTCPECNQVREKLERAPRLQERLDRLEGRLRGRFHDDMACGACGGPLDACRDAICCQCSPEPEVLVAMARLRRAEGILVERDRQDAKWGVNQGKSLMEWYAVLGEEMGELAAALLCEQFGNDDHPELDWRKEATQVAASALAMIEQTAEARPPEGGTTNEDTA